ncbi:MAG: flagellar biosynthesis anti-sigma factor FlgM [Lachnospiraceae bacterium]|nr:flagellar biosynthesis anti-sigma factor FlgM [Lachnospiraceae bacterium]
MRIDAMNQVSQIYQKSGTRKVAQANKTSFADKLELSQIGKDMQVAKAAVKASPDVRENRVNEIKAAIANGTYSVSNEDLAEKLAGFFGA